MESATQQQPDSVSEQSRGNPADILNPYKWKKGQSGNPHGRRKANIDAVQNAHDLAPNAIKLLWTMANDKSLPAAVRRQCANDILDRSLGKVTRSVAIGIQNLPAPESGDPFEHEMRDAMANASGMLPTPAQDVIEPLPSLDPFAPSGRRPVALAGQETGSSRPSSATRSTSAEDATKAQNKFIGDMVAREVIDAG